MFAMPKSAQSNLRRLFCCVHFAHMHCNAATRSVVDGGMVVVQVGRGMVAEFGRLEGVLHKDTKKRVVKP